MTGSEVRSYNIPQDKRGLIHSKFDSLDGSQSSNVVKAIELYIDNLSKVSSYSPRFYDDIESWVSYIHNLRKGEVKKFGDRLEQINRIFGDVK